MKYAIIENGTVVNIAVAESALADNWIEANGAKIGDTWDGTSFASPPPAPFDLDAWRETATVFKRAMRQAMKLFPSSTHSHMLEEIDVSVAALPDYHPAKDAWRDVSEFQRNHPDVAALAAPFGLTDSEIDALFMVAIALEGGATAQEALAAAGIAV